MQEMPIGTQQQMPLKGSSMNNQKWAMKAEQFAEKVKVKVQNYDRVLKILEEFTVFDIIRTTCLLIILSVMTVNLEAGQIFMMIIIYFICSFCLYYWTHDWKQTKLTIQTEKLEQLEAFFGKRIVGMVQYSHAQFLKICTWRENLCLKIVICVTLFLHFFIFGIFAAISLTIFTVVLILSVPQNIFKHSRTLFHEVSVDKIVKNTTFFIKYVEKVSESKQTKIFISYSSKIYKVAKNVTRVSVHFISNHVMRITGFSKKGSATISITQQAINTINDVQISTTSEAFYSGEQNLQLNDVKVSAIALKILGEVYDKSATEFVVMSSPKLLFFQGNYIEVTPTGKTKTCQNKCNVYQVPIGGQNIERQSMTNHVSTATQNHFFNQKTFNLITFVQGSLSNNQETHKIANTDSEIMVKHISDKITEKQIRNVKEYNKIDFTFVTHNPETDSNSNPEIVISFQKIFQRFNYVIEFQKQSINTIILKENVLYVLKPNYKIVQLKEATAVWEVKKKGSNQIYYFTNPFMEPIFVEGAVPRQLEKYAHEKHEKLAEARLNQKANDYKHLNSIKDKRIGVIDKYYSEEVEYLKKILTEAGANLVFFEKNPTRQIMSGQFDVIIYICSQGVPPQEQIDFIKTQNKKGTGIFLWADNQPFFGEVNSLLKQLQGTFSLSGNYYGTKTLQVSNKASTQGTFDVNHPVSAGFVNLYEGVTICYPNGPISDFSVFAYNTNTILQPSILYRNPTLERGGIWIDSGFTKLFPSCHTTGEPEVRQYTINAISYISKRVAKTD